MTHFNRYLELGGQEDRLYNAARFFTQLGLGPHALALLEQAALQPGESGLWARHNLAALHRDLGTPELMARLPRL